MARVIQVIEATICRGKGTEASPIYSATQYFQLDGTLIYETPAPEGCTRGGIIGNPPGAF